MAPRLVFIAVALLLSCGKQAVVQRPQAQPDRPPPRATQPARPATRPDVPATPGLPLSGVVYFDFDRAEVRPDQRPVLETLAAMIRIGVFATVILEGHADERGTLDYNLALGQRRADAVRKYLIGLGVRPDQLWTVSIGEERPADPGHDETAWAKNRRVEIGR